MSGELAYLGLAEAAELIRTKKLSPVEYVTALLARIERYDAKYNAFIALTPERALTAARSAEAEIAAGRRRGPFHGMPYALKDIIDVEGLATTAQSKILRGNTARRHAVERAAPASGGDFGLGRACRLQRPFRRQCDEGVVLAVVASNAVAYSTGDSFFARISSAASANPR